MFMSLLQQLGCLFTASEESPLGVLHLFGLFLPLVKCSCTLELSEKGVVGSAPEQTTQDLFGLHVSEVRITTRLCVAPRSLGECSVCSAG